MPITEKERKKKRREGEEKRPHSDKENTLRTSVTVPHLAVVVASNPPNLLVWGRLSPISVFVSVFKFPPLIPKPVIELSFPLILYEFFLT